MHLSFPFQSIMAKYMCMFQVVLRLYIASTQQNRLAIIHVSIILLLRYLLTLHCSITYSRVPHHIRCSLSIGALALRVINHPQFRHFSLCPIPHLISPVLLCFAFTKTMFDGKQFVHNLLNIGLRMT